MGINPNKRRTKEGSGLMAFALLGALIAVKLFGMSGFFVMNIQGKEFPDLIVWFVFSLIGGTIIGRVVTIVFIELANVTGIDFTGLWAFCSAVSTLALFIAFAKELSN
ncbi:hypothetical protein AKJ40_03270 [candidate division MSBL1 archaeon SCGC-AAA259M10]|uniref:Uncharacterized protein n=1 Tax=candidate division MSBL1 archaeon SCGC-AAA259M10 TaxID=1698270 RepID=A0A133UYY8_9EURY|nr:hypothetical protein AKJ40_03270 [candidate division MSBL1 archaeon SCGC-AAA259M10]